MTRELTHAETIVETNSKGQQLCRPRYGCYWSISEPHQREGWSTTLYMGSGHDIRTVWNAHYATK